MDHIRRIAILDPGLVFSEPARPKANPVSLAELRAWTKKALDLGADAVYARVYRETAPFAHAILETLSEMGGLELIAPAQLYREDNRAGFYHFRGEEPNRLPARHLARCGRSCHSLEEAMAAQAEGMDYVFLSPVFSTKTHPGAPALGLEKLREVCQKVTIPVFALGGIDAGREKACREAGAHGIAAIRMFLFESGNA